MLGWLRRLVNPTVAASEAFAHLWPGCAYQVVRAFADHDGIDHPVGERWTFVRHSFLPYEDGLTLFVDIGTAHCPIRLQWRDDAEGAIIDHLHDHVHPLPSAADRVVMTLTRDGVCLADDVEAPHVGFIEVKRDASPEDVASAILAESYLAWVGRDATWSFAMGEEQMVLGYRRGTPFLARVAPALPSPAGNAPANAHPADPIHLTYHAQMPAAEVIATLAARRNQTLR